MEIFCDPEDRRESARVFEAMPLRISALHFCTPDEPMFRFLSSLIMLTLTQKERKMTRVHKGTTHLWPYLYLHHVSLLLKIQRFVFFPFLHLTRQTNRTDLLVNDVWHSCVTTACDKYRYCQKQESPPLDEICKRKGRRSETRRGCSGDRMPGAERCLVFAWPTSLEPSRVCYVSGVT